MKVTEKKLDDGRIELEAIAATAEVAQALNVAHYGFCQQMGVQPQPGKTPAQAAEEQLGIKDLDAMCQQQAIEYLVPFAVDKRNIVPAYPPKPQVDAPLRRGQTFAFKLRVTPKPAYELKSYDPVSITVPPLAFDESEVDRQMQQFAEGFSEFKAAEPHEVRAGDCMLISLEVFQGGKRLDNLSTEGRTYIMGMQLMPDEFEQQLFGMNVGDTKQFQFSMPGAPEGEPPFDCTVTVKEMQERIVPEITDEWVAGHMPLYRSAAALRGGITESLRAQAAAQHNEMKMAMATAELAKRFQGKIADEVYESMRETMMANLRGNLQQQGVPFEQFVQAQGGEQQFGMMMMLQTREMLVQGYALDALFRHEKLFIDDADIEAVCRTMNPQDPSAARRQMEGNGQGFALREMAERLKASAWLLEHAEVTVEGEAAPAEGKPAE